jgi:hypothetical protein
VSIVAGEDARYRLVLSDPDSHLGSRRRLAGLVFQPVSWHVPQDEPRAVAFVLAGDVASAEIAVSIAVPPAMPQGLYPVLPEKNHWPDSFRARSNCSLVPYEATASGSG